MFLNHEPSVPADGSSSSVLEFVPHLNKNPDNGNNPKNVLKRYMYHLPWKDFPRGYIFAPVPLSRDRGQPSFTAHCLTMAVGFHRYIIANNGAFVK